MDNIKIKGARTNNLKNIDLVIPRNQLIVVTGVSGSGKSSLAFDTLYAEGQRRYVESLSVYARQFLPLIEKPDLDYIEGLSPAIAIEQKSRSHNPRSTVGTVTEILDYLRLLYARVGEPRCPQHNKPLVAQTISQMVDQILTLTQQRVILLAPVIKQRKGEHSALLKKLMGQGYIRARINGEICDLSDPPNLALHKKHTIEVIVDRFIVHGDLAQRIAESLESALALTDGIVIVERMDDSSSEPLLLSASLNCPYCGYSISQLEPRFFSFNNPAGACPTCDGLGVQHFINAEKVIQDPIPSRTDNNVDGSDKKKFLYNKILAPLAKQYQFNIDTPIHELPKNIQNAILNDLQLINIDSHEKNDTEKVTSHKHLFMGRFFPQKKDSEKKELLTVLQEESPQYISSKPCSACSGTRLREEARHVYFLQTTLPQLVQKSTSKVLEFFSSVELTGQRAEISNKIIRTVCDRLKFLMNVGLDYLTLSRSMETLSGGESQRIRLASQIGSGLMGVIYVLDEPSIGLHQRDNERLLQTLRHLRDIGNTVVIVEHDEEAIRTADHIIDMGPGAGIHGGKVVAQGTVKQVTRIPGSLTGQYLSGKRFIPIPVQRTSIDPQKVITLTNASGNNLKNVTLTLPIGLFTCITGVSGSGKSTLINDTLFRIASRYLNRVDEGDPSSYKLIDGLHHLERVIDINQSPIGRTPRSNPATYVGLLTPIRELFSSVPQARARGYRIGRFSFNVRGGRCEACQGEGIIKIEMHFLPDTYVPCDHCKGQRYNRETLEIKYKGYNICQVLAMTVEDASYFFAPIPTLKRKLQTLMDVGLGYLQLGQAATTLSGGEAQRIKLARELAKRNVGKTLYILDEPTTGLHLYDIQQLLCILHKLRDLGHTIIVIEHHLDIMKTADWIIDLGPEGGDGGGEIVAFGTPEQVVKNFQSHTAHFLKHVLKDTNK